MASVNLFAPVRNELEIVERRLLTEIKTEVPILREASIHLLEAGGKRLRPAFFLIAGKIFSAATEILIPMAVALEMVHMATLIHDDLIDNSDLRRGQKTVKFKFGNRMSIYSGNYLFSRSLSLAAGYNRRDIMDMLADASLVICEGEIDQLKSSYNIEQDLKDYLRRIKRKTALLISLSCELGGMIAQADPLQIKALKKYGHYLGMAFQISDDILDYTANEKILGKPIGSDIRQGLITLPLLYASQYSPYKRVLRELMKTPEACQRNAAEIIAIVKTSSGIDYAYNICDRYLFKAKQELRGLPTGNCTSCLNKIADYIARRNF